MKRYILTFLYIITFVSGSFAFAQTPPAQAPITGEYTVLAPLPGTTKVANCTGDNCKADINSYLGGLFGLAIGIGAVIAMILIGFYGFQYAMSDSASIKMANSAKLWEIVQGLLLLISAYAIIYTINPNLLSFNLEITAPKSFAPTSTATSTTTSGGAIVPGGSRIPGCVPPGCSNTATVNGTIVTLPTAVKPCEACTSVPNALSVKTRNIAGVPAQINTELSNRLLAIQSANNELAGQPGFQLTETWPLTQDHLDQRQYNGTSVDLAFTSPPTAQQITNFISIANNNSIFAQFEVRSQSRVDYLISQGVPRANVLLVPQATGEHFSIYKK